MKPWRGPRNKKTTHEMKLQMQELRKSGWLLKDIAKHFGVSVFTIRYHIVLGVKEKHRLTAQKANKKARENWTPEQKNKRQEYQRKYMNERYHDDPEFRRRILNHISKYDQKTHGSKEKPILTP